jgi:hypothetical protein
MDKTLYSGSNHSEKLHSYSHYDNPSKDSERLARRGITKEALETPSYEKTVWEPEGVSVPPVEKPVPKVSEFIYPTQWSVKKWMNDAKYQLEVQQLARSSDLLIKFTACRIYPNTQNNSSYYISWKLSKPIMYDLDVEWKKKGTIEHCIKDFQTQVQDVIRGLQALEMNEIYCDPATLRIVISTDNQLMVAPQNLLLYLVPKDASAVARDFGKDSLIQQMQKERSAKFGTYQGLGKLLLKLLCLDQKNFGEHDSVACNKLEESVMKLKGLHFAKFSKHTDNSFMLALVKLIKELYASPSNAAFVPYQNILMKLNICQKKSREESRFDITKINNRELHQIRSVDIGQKRHYDVPAVNAYTATEMPYGMKSGTNQGNVKIRDKIDEKKASIQQGSKNKDKAQNPSEIHKKQFTESSKASSSGSKVDIQKSKHSQAQVNKERPLTASRAEAAKLNQLENKPSRPMTRAAMEYLQPPGQSVRLEDMERRNQELILSALLSHEQLYMSMLLDTHTTNLHAFRTVPDNPTYQQIKELLLYCTCWNAAKFLRATDLTKDRINMRCFYPMTQPHQKITDAAQKIFLNYVSDATRLNQYKKNSESLAYKATDVRTRLREFYQHAITYFNTTPAKRFLHEMCNRAALPCSLQPLDSINNQMQSCLLEMVAIIEYPKSAVRMDNSNKKILKDTVARNYFLQEVEKSDPFQSRKPNPNASTFIEALAINDLAACLKDNKSLEQLYTTVLDMMKEKTQTLSLQWKQSSHEYPKSPLKSQGPNHNHRY